MTSSKNHICDEIKCAGKDEAYWNEFSKNWKEKIESKVFEMYMPVYEKHLTLEELKAVAAFYESPVGKNIKRLH